MTKGFFNNFKNADTLGGLVEDIRDAMLDYQVCAPNKLFPLRLISLQTSLQQDVYDRSFLLIVRLAPSPFPLGLVD